MILLPLVLGWFRVQGQARGLYDDATGTGMLVIALIIVFSIFLWISTSNLSRSAAAEATANQFIRESEARLKHAQQIANVGSWEWDIGTGALWWSDQTYRQMGEQPGQLTPSFDAFNQRVHPEDRGAFAAAIEQALAEASLCDLEFRIIRPEGATRVLHARGEVVYSSDGRPLRMVGVSLDITGRKQSEEALRERERLLQTVIDGSTSPIFLKDLDGKFITINAALERMLGISREKIKGKTDYDIASKEIADCWRSHDKQVIGACKAIQVEEVADLSDGHHIFLANKFPLVDVDGHLYGVGAISHDITERKRAEAALRDSERMYRAIGESIDYGVWVCDPEGRNLYASDSFLKLVGITQQQCSEFGWGDTLHPDDAECTIAAWKECVRTGGTWDIEHRFRGTDGEWHPILARGVPVRNEQGQIVSWAGINLDIGRLKRTEEALHRLNVELEQRVEERTAELAQAARKVQAERQRLFDVLETLPAMICLLTPDYHVTFANRSFRDRFGDSRGRHCYEFCFGYTAPCEFCESYQVLKTGQPHHWEFKTQDGSVIDAYDFPFTDVDGSPLILEMELDITASRRAENEVRLAQSNLESRAAQLQALAGELTLVEQRERSRLAKILHDHLQQLLVAAKFRTTILGRGGDEVIKQASKEVEDLINESIAVSRDLTAELSPPILHEAGLNAGLQWLSRRMAEKHGLFVDLEMDEDGPLTEQLRILLFDSVRELLFNTAKHAHTSSATVNSRHVDGRLQITVSDRGAGFDPSTMPAAGGGGIGFGLFGIRERLELMGGALQIQSTPGQGSLFVISVPVAPITKTEPQSPEILKLPEVALQSRSHEPWRKIRVMLADDHTVVRHGIAKMLSDEPDLEVVGAAGDGQEAVEMAARLRPDVILMDLSMPKLNGIEATQAIHEEFPEIRIIGISMFEETERAQAMREAGAVCYLTKSGAAEALIAAVRKHGARQEQTFN